jgi:hypothetical protein
MRLIRGGAVKSQLKTAAPIAAAGRRLFARREFISVLVVTCGLTALGMCGAVSFAASDTSPWLAGLLICFHSEIAFGSRITKKPSPQSKPRQDLGWYESLKGYQHVSSLIE